MQVDSHGSDNSEEESFQAELESPDHPLRLTSSTSTSSISSAASTTPTVSATQTYSYPLHSLVTPPNSPVIPSNRPLPFRPDRAHEDTPRAATMSEEKSSSNPLSKILSKAKSSLLSGSPSNRKPKSPTSAPLNPNPSKVSSPHSAGTSRESPTRSTFQPQSSNPSQHSPMFSTQASSGSKCPESRSQAMPLSPVPPRPRQYPSSSSTSSTSTAQPKRKTPRLRQPSTSSRSVHTQQSHFSSSTQAPPSASADANPEGLFPRDHLVRNIHRYCRYSSAAYGQNFLRVLGLGATEFMFPTTGRHHANSWGESCSLFNRAIDVLSCRKRM